MNETVYTILEDLNKSYPLPAQTLTLPQVCEVLNGVKLKTIQNNISLNKCPFPVIKALGKILVSKHALAILLAGGDPFETTTNKPKTGRPKNSDRLQRFVCRSMLTIFDEMNNQRQKQSKLEKRLLLRNYGDKAFKPYTPKHL
jgi:hypothetical protein